MTDFWNDSPSLGSRIESVVSLMDETIASTDFPLAEALRGLVGSNGKMLRPALLLIGARFGKGADDRRITALAASIELLHVATLIHDDILDEAELRRGVPTIHTQFGTKEAVLAGDWLLSRSFRLASESAAPENAQALGRLIGAICSAEIGQDLGKYRYDCSVRRYLRTIAGKTAALFSLALHAGATEAKVAPRLVVQRLRRAGYGIGMAFQVIDDILDFESSEGVMGKPVGKDLREGLCTLPLIYALQADRGSLEGLLARSRKEKGQLDQASIDEIVDLTARLGGLDRARETAHRFTARTLAEINGLPNVPARAELAALASKLLERTY
ncbi:MAG TPA: polyprenyl synthetase family protein [Rectinemataceae bacterium]|nr:polyprenyl synthetase family protein [Rectinemataceae bacterium]